MPQGPLLCPAGCAPIISEPSQHPEVRSTVQKRSDPAGYNYFFRNSRHSAFVGSIWPAGMPRGLQLWPPEVPLLLLGLLAAALLGSEAQAPAVARTSFMGELGISPRPCAENAANCCKFAKQRLLRYLHQNVHPCDRMYKSQVGSSARSRSCPAV